MRISIEKAREQFRVESDSGHQYHITYAGSGDADPEYVALWRCDCPARGGCKHLRAFLATRLMDVGDPYYRDDENLPTEWVG